jgi:hypothetical protein
MDSSQARASTSDRKTAEQEIRAVETRWREVIARKGTVAIASSYKNDAILCAQDRRAAESVHGCRYG